MDIKELRIGNYVDQASYCGLMRIACLYYDKTYVDLIGPYQTVSGRFDLAGIYPIELTKEWFIKMGFESIASNVPNLVESTPFDGQRQIRWDSIDGLAIQTVGSGWIWRLKDIKYVHQLQNLYFALTGKELTIK